MLKVTEFMQIQSNLNELDSKQDYSLLIDQETFKQCVKFHKRFFFEVTSYAPTVIICGISGNIQNIQKMKYSIIKNIQQFTGKGVMAIGSGYQDIQMLQ